MGSVATLKRLQRAAVDLDTAGDTSRLEEQRARVRFHPAVASLVAHLAETAALDLMFRRLGRGRHLSNAIGGYMAAEIVGYTRIRAMLNPDQGLEYGANTMDQMTNEQLVLSATWYYRDLVCSLGARSTRDRRASERSTLGRGDAV